MLKQLRDSFAFPFRFCSIRNLIIRNLERWLPENAHELCTNRLGLSVTKLWTFENRLISEFNSRQELIDAIVAGCFIPIWSGTLSFPTFLGEKYIDGAYSNNIPKFKLTPEEQQSGVRRVEVCPFASEVEVSPRHEWKLGLIAILGTRYYINWNNVVRSHQAVIPYNIETYKPQLYAGHRDMKDFVLRSNLVKCRGCHENTDRSRISIDKSHIESNTRMPCLSCLMLLEKVDSLKLPICFE